MQQNSVIHGPTCFINQEGINEYKLVHKGPILATLPTSALVANASQGTPPPVAPPLVAPYHPGETFMRNARLNKDLVKAPFPLLQTIASCRTGPAPPGQWCFPAAAAVDAEEGAAAGSESECSTVDTTEFVPENRAGKLHGAAVTGPIAMAAPEGDSQQCSAFINGSLGSPEIPTIGSKSHSLGMCKPCAFVFKGGCGNGVNCSFCHLCEPGEKKRRKKESKVRRRMRECPDEWPTADQ